MGRALDFEVEIKDFRERLPLALFGEPGFIVPMGADQAELKCLTHGGLPDWSIERDWECLGFGDLHYPSGMRPKVNRELSP